MAKIRGVKPEFWTDEDICELGPFARLLFIGMWNYACDNGHLQDKPKQIKRRILVDDDVNCSDLLREIEAQGLIERADGWITIPNLTRHQKPDRRYFTTCEREDCIEPEETVSQRKSRRAHGERTGDAQRANSVRTSDALGDGDGEVKGSDGDSAPAGKPAKRATQLPTDFRPSEKHLGLAEELGVNLRAEWPQFCDHHRAKGSTMKDWNAALNTWIRNAARFGRTSSPSSAGSVRYLPDGSVDTSTLPPIDNPLKMRSRR